jgi:ATP-dependent exoDNAse (exonuclease V) alpha subunit
LISWRKIVNINREKIMTLPVKHLSARVPWHDNKWNGTYCCNTLDNSFCRILPRVDDIKDAKNEDDGQFFDEHNLPPCFEEGGAFLSSRQYSRKLEHKLKDRNDVYRKYLPGTFIHKPFSYSSVPFLWMMKSKAKDGHISEKAITYGLDYKSELEEEIGEFLGEYNEKNKWIQHPENQRTMLESFYGCLKENISLIFFYAKHTPLSEPNERIIIGVAKVKHIGKLESFTFPHGFKSYRGYPWDRCIEHTLTDKNPEGFLLPYHELIEKAKTEEIDLSEFKVIAPDRVQFSYSSELVENDTAIDALWRIAECLRKSSVILDNNYRKELSWIENEISRIWNMRGAFPGMGAVLSTIKMEGGNAMAWELEKFIREKDGVLLKTNPWILFENSIKDPVSVIKDRGKELFNHTNITIWKRTPQEKKDFYKLISRIQLNNDQAEIIIDEFSGNIENITKNPYKIYEDLRIWYKGEFSFNQIDKAVFPIEKLRNAFPLEGESAMIDKLDCRRVRACTVMILNEASDQGHSLLPFGDTLEKMTVKEYSDSFPINSDILKSMCEDVDFREQVLFISDGNNNFLKLQNLVNLKNIITQRVSEKNLLKKYNIKHDWKKLVNDYFKEPGIKTVTESDKKAREEKAHALDVLCNNKVSVLIGPAGSGKTTVLEILEKIDEIKKGGLIKLAPTGKARVKLGHDANTIATFLNNLDRYDAGYQIYYPNPDAAKDSSARNIIIDESSMLTEEMLAAVFDALGPMDRIILVGDYRQLPPIGTGRPFVDIINLLKNYCRDNGVEAGYAELKQIMRQNMENSNEKRLDIALSRCFGDEPQKEDIELLQELSGKQSAGDSHIRLEKWYNSKDFRELFEKVLKEELLDDSVDKNDINEVIKAINRTLGAKDDKDYQYFNYNEAEKMIENWQIISPINGYNYGVREINKLFQKTYRQTFLDLANDYPNKNNYWKTKIPKPFGDDNIVYGDKVISLKNAKWGNKFIYPNGMKDKALRYFANGEIGIITGEFLGKEEGHNIRITFSTQPGYSYSFWPNELGEDDKYPFELAYAITVHKSQGSGFKKVFFILPSGGPILSRELIYTAITRQEEKIIILHQGDFRDFIKYSGTEASATARRFTDLYFLPTVKEYRKKFYDARYINISERGEPMISKSEVIIANCLNKYKSEITYAYENKLEIKSSGRTIKPDFTIEHIASGRTIYWEHLGMMTQDNYREKWLKKKQGYLDDGFVVFTDAKEDDEKILILTEDNPNGGVDSKYFDDILKKYILGVSENS